MPFIGGQEQQLDPLALIQWLTQRRMQQGKNLLDTAEPGATVGSTGLDPKTFAAMFGKGVKYDPNRIIRPETSVHLLDRAGQSYLQSLTPQQLLDVGATATNALNGTPGQTTVAGAEAGRQAGAVQAKTSLTKAQTAAASADDVLQRTLAGIKAWGTAPTETQTALNQKLAMGATPTEIDQGEKKAQLATSAIKQAILAQTDPKHPIHAFLKKNDLDLNTVLAGSAMGIDSLFGDYASYQQRYSLANKEQSNILLRMYTDSAKEMSEKIFGGKLSPGQVLTIIKSREDGTALPPGMEGAASVYDRAVQANFDANMQTELQKGDPYLQSLHDQIKLLEKQTDPSALSQVAELVRSAAGYAATKQQLGAPQNPGDWRVFNKVWEQNTKRATGVKYDAPWFGSNSWQPTGGDVSSTPNIPATVADAMRPRPAVRMGAMPANLGVTPIAGAPATGNPVSTAAGQLSDDDQKAIADYLKTLGVSLPGAPGKPPQ